MSEPKPPQNVWPAIVALGMILAFIAFLIWLVVAR